MNNPVQLESTGRGSVSCLYALAESLFEISLAKYDQLTFGIETRKGCSRVSGTGIPTMITQQYDVDITLTL